MKNRAIPAQVEPVVIANTLLTKADKATIEHIPDGWFDPLDLSYLVRAKEYRCQRLEKVGILKSRIVGDYPQLRREYHKR